MSDDTKCRECGAPNDDGEGWDGLCGDCADRAENESRPSRGAFIAAARELYGNDTVGIDDNAILSEYDEGAWVMAWLDVSDSAAAAHEGDAEAATANATKPYLGHSQQQQLVYELTAAYHELLDANDSGHNLNRELAARIEALLADVGAPVAAPATPAATDTAVKPYRLALVLGREDTRAVEEDGQPLEGLPTYQVLGFDTEQEQTAYLAGLSDGLGNEEYHARPINQGAKP